MLHIFGCYKTTRNSTDLLFAYFLFGMGKGGDRSEVGNVKKDKQTNRLTVSAESIIPQELILGHTCLLSELQLTAYMLPLWPSSEDSSPIFSPVFASYIKPFLSEPTVINLLPSGENLTQFTKFKWSLQVNVSVNFRKYKNV